MPNELTVRPEDKFSLAPRTMKEAMDYATMIAQSGLCPAAFKGKPGDVMLAVQMGAELGVSPMQALQNITIIQGRAVVWGDLLPAIVEGSGLLSDIDETWDPATQTATCTVLRKGRSSPATRTFSMEDAKRAGLTGKDTYKQYPQRMCAMRARAWAFRDTFGDVLKGIAVREEAEDAPPARVIELPRRAQAEAPAPVAEPEPPGDPEQPPADSGTWTGKIIACTEKQGTRPKTGAPYTIYNFATDDDQVFGTFSTTVRGMAVQHMDAGDTVTVKWKRTQYGNLNIDDITVAELE